MELYYGLQLLILAFIVSCVARVFLASVQPDKLFAKWFYYLEGRYEDFSHSDGFVFWLSPFGWCEICTAFWIGLIVSIPLFFLNIVSLIGLVFMPFIVATIIYNKWA